MAAVKLDLSHCEKSRVKNVVWASPSIQPYCWDGLSSCMFGEAWEEEQNNLPTVRNRTVIALLSSVKELLWIIVV